jgi:alpha-amylase
MVLPRRQTALETTDDCSACLEGHWSRQHLCVPLFDAFAKLRLLPGIPPACKASSPSGNGYDIYDLYDLGEFDQKGSVGTKWGTKKELVELSKKANEVGVGLYFDAVLNHKGRTIDALAHCG